MSLVSPLLLGLLLLGVPIAWAYLRRAQPRRSPVSSLLLLRQVAAVPTRRRRFDRLLSLLLVLLALLCLTLTTAVEPAPPTRPALVVIDHSASMATSVAGQTRLDRARGALDAWLADWPATPVTVVATPPLRTLIAETRDHAAVQAAVAAVEPGGQSAAPWALIQDACDAEDPPQVLLLSEALAPPEDFGCPVARPDLGGSVSQVGITALVARPVDGLGLVELQVETTGEADALALSVDGGPAQALDAASGLAWLSLPAGGTLQLATVADGLPLDDTATVQIPAESAVRVTLVTAAPQGYAALALQAHPRVQLTTVAPGESAPPADLLVLEALPAGAPPPARLTVALGIDPAALSLPDGPSVERPEITAVAEDPALRWASLDGLFVARSRVLAAPPGATALLSADAGALAVRHPRPDAGDVLLFGFSLEESDLALRAAWANVVANLVDEAAGGPETLLGAGLLSAEESAGSLIAGDGLPTRPLQAALSLLGLLAFGLLAGETGVEALRRRRG